MKEKEKIQKEMEEKEKPVFESPNLKKISEIPVKQLVFATPGTPSNQIIPAQRSLRSPSNCSQSSRTFATIPPMIEGPCSVVLDAVNALQHAANSQLIKVTFNQ